MSEETLDKAMEDFDEAQKSFKENEVLVGEEMAQHLPSDRKSIISEYMRELGRRGGATNKAKGREYFSKIGHKRLGWRKRKVRKCRAK